MRMNKELSQEVAQMKTALSLYMKQHRDGPKKMNIVGLHARAQRYEDYKYDEDAYYVNDQTGGFRTNAQRSNQDTRR